MKSNTCCFAGHRTLPLSKVEAMIERLNVEIDNLYNQGVTHYISGGALGFDQIAASLIIAKKEIGYNMRLIFALPCKDQDRLWNDKQKQLYHNLLAEADEIYYVSEEYHDGCMKKRNYYMVEQSAYLICALLHGKSGTKQTVAVARKNGLHIINLL